MATIHLLISPSQACKAHQHQHQHPKTLGLVHALHTVCVYMLLISLANRISAAAAHLVHVHQGQMVGCARCRKAVLCGAAAHGPEAVTCRGLQTGRAAALH